jgi:hypothetical protein
MAADMKGMKTAIEHLSDNILYAGNFDGVRSTGDQHYINDYRQIRQLLDPIQTALKKPILSSALISAPPPIELGDPRQFLYDITPIERMPEIVDDDWVPVLFKEGDIYYVGWKPPTDLSQQLGCYYLPQWQPNHNQLPGKNLVSIGKLLGKLDEDEIVTVNAKEEPTLRERKQAPNEKTKTETVDLAKRGQAENVRYIDNGDGTVTDNRTGLIWLKKADCLGRHNWKKAMQLAAKLADGQCGLSDGSKAGDWRLPTKEEWKAMLDKKYEYPALSNAAGTGQWKEGDAFSGVSTSWTWYWSSTKYDTSSAWFVFLSNGIVSYYGQSSPDGVWAVRGGH